AGPQARARRVPRWRPFFYSSRRRHTRWPRDWSSDVCSSDLPAILDPNFERAVVLITAHTDEGAVGVILNRCSAATVGEAVPQLAPVIDADEPVFVGGPVNPDGVAVLAEFEDPEEAGIVGVGRVRFVPLEEALE